MFPIKIAVIKKTQNYIDYHKSKNEILENIKEIAEDSEFIKYDNIENEESFLPKIINYINPNIKIISGTKTYIDNYLYQTMAQSLSNIENINYSNLNKLGTQFCNGIETYDPVILMKSKIISDTESQFESLNKIDVIKFMENIIFKKGVYHKLDNTIETYTYSQNHFDSLIEKYGNDYVVNNYQYDEIEFLDMILIIINKKNTEESKNDLMSNIVKKDVYGDVICCLYSKPIPGVDSNYISIDKDIYLKIIKLLSDKNFKNDDNSFLNKFQLKDIKNEKLDEKDLLISPSTKITRIYNKYYLNDSL